MKAKNKWGVVVGKPTFVGRSRGLTSALPCVGQWVVGASADPTQFDTRREAREYAKKNMANNKYWHYHAKKMS